MIEDKPVLKGDALFATKTLPDMLYLEESRIPGAGAGVFAKDVIQKGVRFGPYLGTCILNEEEAHKSGYSWEV